MYGIIVRLLSRNKPVFVHRQVAGNCYKSQFMNTESFLRAVQKHPDTSISTFFIASALRVPVGIIYLFYVVFTNSDPLFCKRD